MIHNLCPLRRRRANRIPWADGRCPFPRAMWEAAGFAFSSSTATTVPPRARWATRSAGTRARTA